MNNFDYITLRERAELKSCAAEWFHCKWGVPTEAYLECMEAYAKALMLLFIIELCAAAMFMLLIAQVLAMTNLTVLLR